jgi:Flp pilus assembly protein TadG
MKSMKRQTQECGFVVVTFAVCLVALIGFLALAIDIGIAYSARTQAQAAADAGALAGASSYSLDSNSPQPATATSFAQAVVAANPILGQAATSVSVDFPQAQLIRVTVDATASTYFARALGISSIPIEVVGIAEKPNPGGFVKPWFVPSTVFDSVSPTTCTASQACADSELLLKQTASGYAPTTLATSRYGQIIVLKPGDPQQHLASGQFFEIQFPGQTGGNDYRDDIEFNNAAAYCLNNYGVLTGNKQGPTKQGVQDLISPGGISPDTYVSLGHYSNGTTTSDWSRSLVTVPIWDTCSLSGMCPSNNFPNGGGTQLSVIGFALVFIDGVDNQGTVTAHMIGVSGCGNTAGSPPDGQLRLVHM